MNPYLSPSGEGASAPLTVGSHDGMFVAPGNHDEPFVFGNVQHVTGTGPFTLRQLAKLLIVRADFSNRCELGR